MAEWLYEAGIGENRAALVQDGSIAKARIERLNGSPRLGAVLPATLVERGRVALAEGGEAVIDRVDPRLSLGRTLNVEIIREAIPEDDLIKLPKAIPSQQAPRPGPSLIERIAATGLPVRRCHAHEPDLLEAAGWSEVLGEAETLRIAFPGGLLRLALTPAMTLIDVDGEGPPARLAVAAATASARAIVRHGIGGSIGIDFPTLAGKAERQAVADAIDAALPLPFERTAVNGFGFLQIVRRRARPSLPELIRADPVTAAALAALRRAERIPPPPPATHIVPQTVARRIALRPDWLDALARRTGGRTQFVAEGSE